MRTKVFNALLDWIEMNLSATMKVEDIAKKSGYSRRYIYQLFVEKLGLSPIDYLRRRRLCLATNWLKLTNASGQQIAQKLGYSSYQTFSRDFKKHFNVSPVEFRRHKEWNMAAIQVTHFINNFHADCSSHEIFIMPKIEISGYEFSYTESVPYFAENRSRIRKAFISQEIKRRRKEVYIFSEAEKKDDDNYFSVKCFIGAIGEGGGKKCTSKTLDSGKYFKYIFKGDWEEYRRLPTYLSARVLPSLRLKRRDIYDIEKIYYTDEVSLEEYISCEYYIPII